MYQDVWLNGVDIFVMAHDVYFGDVTDQDIDISAGDIFTIDSPINVFDLMFKNKVAGSNTKIVLVGVPMTTEQMKRHGVGY